VKQHDLGEYEENTRENQDIQVYKSKAPIPPQIKPYGWQSSSFELKRIVTKPRGFSMQKSILPLKLRRITSSPSNQGKSNQASTLIKDADST
jgi:hypothetical protein